jgi:hypothetical protein
MGLIASHVCFPPPDNLPINATEKPSTDITSSSGQTARIRLAIPGMRPDRAVRDPDILDIDPLIELPPAGGEIVGAVVGIVVVAVVVGGGLTVIRSV